MKRILNIITLTFIFLCLHTHATANNLHWKEINFPTISKNTYEVIGETVRIHSHKSASLLIAKVPEEFWYAPCMHYEWQVSSPFFATNLDTKGSDDRPVSVIAWFGNEEAHPSLFAPLPDGALLNLTFGSDLPKGKRLVSPYKQESVIWVLQNHKSPTGQWISENLPVRQMAKTAFEGEIGAMKFLAILSDSDDTNAEYHAQLRNLTFSSTCNMAQ